MLAERDVQRLRALAARWMQIACLPIMNRRKELWRSVKDIKAERPMILIDTGEIIDFVADEELSCKSSFAREIERYMLQNIFQFEEIGDDVVLEPYFHIGWQLKFSDYGFVMNKQTARDEQGREIGYAMKPSIESVEDLKELKIRSMLVDRKATLEYKERLEDIFGDILPVRLGNSTIYEAGPGISSYLGVNFIYVTYEILSLIGNTNLLTWVLDYPQEMKALSEFLIDDKVRIYKQMETEDILTHNTDNHWAGPGSYGYCSDLPPAQKDTPAKLINCWGRTESQESECISPEMFNELFLPQIARACKLFGLVYYGCCERIDDRWEYIKNAIPNLRVVGISPWNNHEKMSEYLAGDYVYSGKPDATNLSMQTLDWDELKKELVRLKPAAKKCSFELLVRDLIVIRNDRKRLSEWTLLAKNVIGM
jgi:hypothetical protein